MKVRNILIGLLVVLMAFVFISCEDEPEEQVTPVQVDDTIYKVTATKGIKDGVFNHDKFSTNFNEKVVAGQTISFEFRSTADFFQVNVRGINGKPKYVYEEDIKEEGNSYTLEPLSDGWTKFSYTFDEDAEENDDFRVDLRGWIMAGDIMELRHVFYGGKQIAMSEANFDAENFACPTFTTVADHAWDEAETYVVAFFTGKPDSAGNKEPVVEAVAKGGNATLAGLAKDNYNLSVFWYDKDGKKGEAFDKDTDTISADTFLLLEYKGVDVNITFHKNYEGAEDEALATTTEFGLPITAPATDDWKRDGWKITGWTTAAEASEDNVFNLSEAVASTEAIEIYAQWSNVATLTLNLNYGDTPVTKVIDVEMGTAPDAAQIARPGWVLSGWTVGSAANSGAYDYSSVLNEDKTIYAQWAEPVHSYKLTATQGNTDLEEGEGDFYDLDKFAVTFDRENVKAHPGDVLAFLYKFENEEDREYKYFSIRGSKKWFTEMKYDAAKYPQSLSSREDIGDGWYSCTYVFPDKVPNTDSTEGAEGVGTKQAITYPAYFRVDIRASSGWCGVGDIIYIKAITLNGIELSIDDTDEVFSQFAAPSIVDLNAAP